MLSCTYNSIYWKSLDDLAVFQLRLLYSRLLKTPLESSDLCWERLKSFVEKGSRSTSKSRRGPRPGGSSDMPCGDTGGEMAAPRVPSTLVEVYDMLTDEQLPLLLQRLQQQKSATLEELQLPAETPAAYDVSTQNAAATREATKARGKIYAGAVAAARPELVLMLMLLLLLLRHHLRWCCWASRRCCFFE